MPRLFGFNFGSGSFYEVGECTSCATLQFLIDVMQNDCFNKTLRSHTINVSFYLNKSSLSLVHCWFEWYPKPPLGWFSIWCLHTVCLRKPFFSNQRLNLRVRLTTQWTHFCIIQFNLDWTRIVQSSSAYEILQYGRYSKTSLTSKLTVWGEAGHSAPCYPEDGVILRYLRRVIIDIWLYHRDTVQGFVMGFQLLGKQRHFPTAEISNLYACQTETYGTPGGLYSDGCPQITSQGGRPNGILIQCPSYLTWLPQQWSSSFLCVLEVLTHNYNDPSYRALF